MSILKRLFPCLFSSPSHPCEVGATKETGTLAVEEIQDPNSCQLPVKSAVGYTAADVQINIAEDAKPLLRTDLQREGADALKLTMRRTCCCSVIRLVTAQADEPAPAADCGGFRIHMTDEIASAIRSLSIDSRNGVLVVTKTARS